MSHRLFGTDGIRAPFGQYPLDRPTLTALGREVAHHLRRSAPRTGRPLVVAGGDTRESTPEIARYLAAGLREGGAELRFAGVIPTPGVAHLTRELGAAAGIAVSASHNPYPDNGVKLIDAQGFKWQDADERAIEEGLKAAAGSALPAEAETAVDPSLREAYLAHLRALLPGVRPLAGLRIVLDTGNGAASPYAAELFGSLGAEVVLLHAEPDGRNVNQGCGSTAPAEAARRTAEAGAPLGAAFDGDADRCILVDDRGEVRDGDAILYLWATWLQKRGALRPAKIVATTMSNLGLERALAREGIGIVRCDVGDRFVVAALQREGLRLGGEQSGHVVDLTLASTGDGLLTALQMAAIVQEAGRPLSELLAGFRRYPQILKNVRVGRKVPFAELPRVTAAAQEVERELGEDGRLVLRYSGTEPLARIMIEGPEQERIDGLAAEIEREILSALGQGC